MDNTYAVQQAQNNSGGRLLISVGSSIVSQGLISSASTFGYGANGPVEWAAVLTGQRFTYRNAGITGQTSTQIRSRFKKDVLQYKPDIIVLQNGTNEINEGADSIWANTVAMADAGLRTGAHVIMCAILPRTSASSWDADNFATAIELNERKRRYCEINKKSHFCDWSKFVTDPTSTNGYAITSMFRDAIHWSNIGAYRGGRALQPIIESILPPIDVISPSIITANGTTHLYGFESVSPSLEGTGGTNGTASTGDVPDSWRSERNTDDDASGSVAGSFPAVTGYDPTRWYQQVFTPGAGTTENFYFRTNTANTSLSSTSDFYEAVCKIEVDAWDGWKNISLEIDDQGTGNKRLYSLGDTYDLNVFPDTAWSGVLKTPMFKTDGAVRLRFRTVIDGAASGTGTHRISNIGVRRLNPDFLPRIADQYDNGVDNKLA